MSEQLIPTPGVFGENGNFLLERELGQGGMGGVYMGRDKMLDRPVAVKVMLKEYGDDQEFVEKFKKEAQACARLIHPNIAQIFSYGICDGMPYMAMELACGGSLYTIMQANPGKTDVARVIKICQQTAQALQCANDQGCVHGDVKPENILLDANGNAKLVDFGLAAMQKDTDEIWGTPYYISPEKVRKDPVDFRADIYSLGGTLYHALTGVAPFEGEDTIAVVKKRFEGDPKRPSEIRPDLTPAIDKLVMKMLALKPEDRYPSFEALIEAFKEVLTSGLTAAPATSATTSAKRPATGTRRMMTTRGRRVMMTKHKTVTAPTPAEGENSSGDGGEIGEEGDVPPKDPSAEVEKGDDDEEEGGGNLGLKIALVIVGIVVALGAIVGGLIWYQIADKKARAAEVQQQIVDAGKKARSAIQETLANAAKFADEFDTFAQKAVTAVEGPTADLIKILPADAGKLLKPAFTKELLEAIASTNPAAAQAIAPVPAPTPAATNAPAAAATNAAPAKTAAPAKEAKPAAKDAKGKDVKGKDAKGKDVKAKATAPAAPAEPPKPELSPAVQQVVAAMNELWERAYGCQASAIRIRVQVQKILEKGKAAEPLVNDDRETVEKLAKLSRELVEELDQVKVSKEVENVKKGIAYIKSKGDKTVEQTVKRLRIEKLEADRKAKAEAAAKAEKERQEKLEAEKAAKIKAESEEATAKFDQLVAQGLVRHLDWKTATRMLTEMRDEFKTPEGQMVANSQLYKIESMKKVHDVFVKSMRDMVFKNKKMRGAKVVKVDDKEITLDYNKRKVRITWEKLYKDYPGALNELINHYVIKGRENAKPKLNLKDWADAMTGAALTMQLVCSEVNGATEKSQQMVKEVLEKFPDRAKTLKGVFPDIELPEAKEEE